jgi:pyruvate dehydrogenase E2 component (dihydrolipoamide acetyltransferase)
VQGTGRGGRIRESDVLAARRSASAVAPAPASGAAAAPVPVPTVSGPPGREVEITTLRRKVAERMHRSKTLTAPVTLTTKAEVGALVNLRAQYKAALAASDDPVPSYSDMMMKLVAAALKEHPALNARWEEARIIEVASINIGVAVDTDAGLMVPVVRDVPALSLRQLTARTSDLIQRARQRRISVEEMSGGTFTVTNLGAANIDGFTPIINHPECAVLGMGRIVREPAVADGKVVIRDAMWLSLTFDHRLVDGAPAARFLDAIRKLVESPTSTLTATGPSRSRESKD